MDDLRMDESYVRRSSMMHFGRGPTQPRPDRAWRPSPRGTPGPASFFRRLVSAVRAHTSARTPGRRGAARHRGQGTYQQAMKPFRILGFIAALALSAQVVGGASADVADAIERGDLAAARALLQKGADVDAPQVDGATGLHWAVYRDDVAAVDLLLNAGAKVNAANRTGVTPLSMAALFGNPEVVDRLLKGGADAKALGPNGETMVMLAARNGKPEVIRLLVEAGADVNAKEPLRG